MSARLAVKWMVMVLCLVFFIVILFIFRVHTKSSEELFIGYLLEDGVWLLVYEQYLNVVGAGSLVERSVDPSSNILKSIVKMQSLKGVENSKVFALLRLMQEKGFKLENLDKNCNYGEKIIQKGDYEFLTGIVGQGYKFSSSAACHSEYVSALIASRRKYTLEEYINIENMTGVTNADSE